MMTLRTFLEEQINSNLIRITISGSRDKTKPSKIGIRPIELRGEIVFQASETVGAQMFHKNFSKEKLMAYLEEMLPDYGQLQAEGRQIDGTVLVSKKGKMTIKTKKHPLKESPKIQSHNRVKQYVLKEGIPVPFLIDLGVMTEQGKIVASRYDKFRQINRFLEFVEDILPQLNKEKEVTILDFGCGKSYLTFALYYYLRVLKEIDVNIIGLDLKTDVIKKCNRLAEKYGYTKLHFYQGDIADYEGMSAVDMVVTLHACDVATDYALAKAVGWDAKVILSVPCCQHEVNKQIHNDMLQPILEYGILKERMSALITDGIRAKLLETKGYETQILEFIDMEHTPKNLLIRAVKTGKKKDRAQIMKTMAELQIQPMLDYLLYPPEKTVEGGKE
ncbi:MAG: SAM-dependent methyltransferase [Eubacteriales bacterium]|nr:SAM-dependent methyltransferase [Eubacteriales bacterium]